jgi:two-component system sensor histidine kinase SenX3
MVVLAGALITVSFTYVRYRRDADAAAGRRRRELEARADRAEAELADLRAAVSETSLGIVVADRSGEQTYANPAAEVVLAGRVGEALVRRSLLDLIESAIASGEELQREVEVHTPARGMVRIRAIPTTDGCVAYIRDLSEQFRIEALRRDFVANAGHELKTPLGALAILAETLRDVEDETQRRRLAERLTDEARRMANVVDDILTLGAIESEEAPFEPVLVVDVVTAATERVAVSAESAGIAVGCEGLDDAVWVEGNREQLVSAVANLLDNAVKYSLPPDPRVDCRTYVDGDEVAIVIEDNGIGIAQSHLNRVFERFYRVDRARSRDTGGTGLGLSIVRNVARTHGGTVTVESELGAGSTFEFRLPVLKTS